MYIIFSNHGTAVYLGFITNDGREVAVKRVVKHRDQHLDKRVDKEVNALIELRHPNTVDYMVNLHYIEFV